jgi:hypothetical protein
MARLFIGEGHLKEPPEVMISIPGHPFGDFEKNLFFGGTS